MNVPQSGLLRPGFLAKQEFATFSFFKICEEVYNSLELSLKFLERVDVSTDSTLAVLLVLLSNVFLTQARAAQGSFDKFNIILTENEKCITKSRHESSKDTMSLSQDKSKAQEEVLNILSDSLVKILVML